MGATFAPKGNWTLRAEGEVMAGELVQAARKGRYQQSVIGLSVKRLF